MRQPGRRERRQSALRVVRVENDELVGQLGVAVLGLVADLVYGTNSNELGWMIALARGPRARSRVVLLAGTI